MRSLRTSRTATEIEARISAILLELQPLLRMDHSQIELVRFAAESGTVILRIDGGCTDCEMSPATFAPAIAAHVKQRVPEVRDVVLST